MNVCKRCIHKDVCGLRYNVETMGIGCHKFRTGSVVNVKYTLDKKDFRSVGDPEALCKWLEYEVRRKLVDYMLSNEVKNAFEFTVENVEREDMISVQAKLEYVPAIEQTSLTDEIKDILKGDEKK